MSKNTYAFNSLESSVLSLTDIEFALDSSLESSVLSLTGIELLHERIDFLHIGQQIALRLKRLTHYFEALFNP